MYSPQHQQNQTYQSITIESDFEQDPPPIKIINALSDLVNLMNDFDMVVICRTVELVYHISKDEIKRRLLINCIPMVQSLIRLADQLTDLEILRYISTVLNDFSKNRAGLQVIYKNNILPTLYKLLSSQTDKTIVNHSIITLHNILLQQEGATTSYIHINNGIPVLIYLLENNNNAEFLTIVMDCLHLTAYKNQDAKQIILQYNGPQLAIQIMNTFDYTKLLLITIRLIKVISVCERNKKVLVESGAMRVLTKSLYHNNKRIVYNSLLALRNLSDMASRQSHTIEKLLQKLVQMLNTKNINVKICLTGILANLTCDNKYSKKIVVQLFGQNFLMQTLLESDDREPTLCALRHLTCKHDSAEYCQNMIRLHFGLKPIIRLLHSSSKWSIIIGSINLIRNLALSEYNIPILREREVIQRLCALLSQTYQNIKQVWLNSQNVTDRIMNTNEVEMFKIIEAILVTLKILSRDEICCEIMIDLNTMHICFDIVYHPMPNIQRIALDCLNRFIDFQSGRDKMVITENITILKNLANSTSEPLRIEAIKILNRLE